MLQYHDSKEGGGSGLQSNLGRTITQTILLSSNTNKQEKKRTKSKFSQAPTLTLGLNLKQAQRGKQGGRKQTSKVKETDGS